MEKGDISHHISQDFNEELQEVHTRVLTMGGLVEKQISDAISALVTCDGHLGEEVATADYKVNSMEVGVDEECSRILARRQPAAGDLRMVMMIIKTITDLERIGDEAEKIARIAVQLSEVERPKNQLTEIRHIGDHVRRMLRGALDAFARMDVDAALDVAKQDAQADREYESVMRQLMTFMMEDPRSIRWIIDIMWCARALERIGDHSTNICEYVIYMVHGKDVRHTTLAEMEKATKAAKRH